MESRLKTDIIREIYSNETGVILLHDETEDGQVVPVWLTVDRSTVTDQIQTTREVFDVWLKEEHHIDFVDYVRIPSTPEQALQEANF